jgi:uncharacterized protein (UPF0332 family)
VNADDYMTKALRALASSKLLFADGDLDGACNRCYYAMFDAAHAALIRSGCHVDGSEIKTHRGLIAAFGKHLVKPGVATADLGKSLNQVERIRLLADYTGEEVDAEQAKWALGQAETFVEAMSCIGEPESPSS